MTRTVRALARLAAAAAMVGGVVLVGSAPAWADTTIPINSGSVPTTASDFGTHSCAQVPGGSSPTTDGWVFVLPGNKGAFTSLTLTFLDTDGNVVVLNIPADGGAILGGGTSKAWIITPAGWTLIAATATISGSSNGFFTLTHTCPATSTPSPSPSTSSPPPTSPSGTPSTSTSSAAALISAATSPGAAVVLVGLGLIGSWSALFVARRRRDTEAS
jgi:hypothetical protein